MINLVIAYDDNDIDLGEYFADSFNTISASVDAALILLHGIRGLDCSEANVNSAILERVKPSIFAGLSHGNAGELGAADVYVSPANCHHFSNTFFYTTGCCAAIQLGPALINAGCNCFIGYNDVSWAPENEDFNGVFIECETYCLREFLASEKRIQETFGEMLDFFDSKIDEFFAANEIVDAIYLQTNKDRLIAIGDTTLTRNDFIAA